MKTTLSVNDFRNAFQRMERNNFSYEGLGVLFEYLESVEDSCGEEFELDVIGICCDFAEDEARGIAESYRIDTQGMNDEQVHVAVLDFLADQGVLIGSFGSTKDHRIVYRQF